MQSDWIRVFVLLLVFIGGLTQSFAGHAAWSLDLASVQSQLERARTELGAATKAADGSNPAQGQAWERRVALLEEAAALLQAARVRDEEISQLDARRTTHDQHRITHDALAELAAPDSPTAEGEAELESELTQLRARVSSMRTAVTARARHIEELANALGRARARLSSALERVVFMVGCVAILAGLWGIDEHAFDALDQWRAYDIRGSGELDEFVSYGDLLTALLIAIGTYYVLKYLPGIHEFGIFSRFELDSGLKYAILTMSRYGLFTMGAIMALSAIHLDLGRLSWLMAAMGVGLGFGLQEIVSNFVCGIILLIERPVRVGDVVTIGSTSGKVQLINIRATSVINFDRQELIVPNRNLITREVTNWTRSDTVIRLVVPIGVTYGTDVDRVTQLLLEIAQAQPDILPEPPPQALFLRHGESSLDFELRVFIPDPSTKLPLQHRLNREINRRLAELGIAIPFPQRDLHIVSSARPWPNSEAKPADR